MVATIILIHSSSVLQYDTSVAASFNLNHSPSDVPSSILDLDSTNATIHPEEQLISTMFYPITNGLFLILLLVDQELN